MPSATVITVAPTGAESSMAHAQPVAQAATLATLALAPPMSTAQARSLLGVLDRRNGARS